jgi:hypothetical protein
MSRKTMVWGGMIIGSSIGGVLPYFWGNYDFFSFQSVILTFLGGVLGIWAAFKLSNLF